MVVSNTQNAVVFARATEKQIASFKLPSECVAVYPFQSHLLVYSPVKVSKAAKGMISPRGEKGGNDMDTEMTQVRACKFLVVSDVNRGPLIECSPSIDRSLCAGRGVPVEVDCKCILKKHWLLRCRAAECPRGPLN